MMRDEDLAVQLCLPLEWIINGSVYTEEEMQEMIPEHDPFTGKFQRFARRYKVNHNVYSCEGIRLVCQDECILMEDDLQKRIRLADCVDELLEDDLDI